MVPGVAAVQDVLKVFFESESGVKSNSKKFHSFRFGSVILASLHLENMITLVFSGFSLILHLAHHVAKFRRSFFQKFCCKTYV